MFAALFSNPGFMAHIHCYLDQQGLVWTMLITDLLIGLAYVAISLTLWALVKRIRIRFSLVVLCFGVFIGACGATHFMEVWTLWYPDYWLAAFLKVITATASVGTGIYLYRLRHTLVAIAETAQLSEDRKVKAESTAARLQTKVNDLESEQVGAGEIIRQSELRFRQLAESLKDQVVHIMELSLTKISYVSPSYERVWGQSVESLYANPQSFLTRVHPDDRYKLLEMMALQEAGEETKTEYRLLFEDGSQKWIRDSSSPVRDGTGKLVRATGIAEDVTQIKLAELRLQESETKFRTITDAMPQIVWSTLPDGYHDYYNKRWYEFTGMPDGSTDGAGWNDIFHPDDRDRAWGIWRESLKTGEPYEIEYRLRRFSGEYRWTLGRALPIRNEAGKIIRWMGTCTDINDQKNASDAMQKAKLEAEHANQMKTTFLANMSHEIRTPLGAILGFAELLSNEHFKSEESQSYVTRLTANSRQLLRLIDELLDLTKIEANRLSVQLSSVNLDSAIDDAISSVFPQTQAKNILVERSQQGIVAPLLLTDALRFQQIIINLLGNAVKFTEAGRIEIAVSVEQKDKLNHVAIRIKDSGIGLSEEQIKSLFQPFNQADGSISRKYGGTGLGLALSRELARLLGGDVVLERSEPGVGSTFLFTFKAATSNALAITRSEAAPSMSAAGQLKGKRILIVDDSADNRFLVSKYLEKTNAILTLAQHGAEAMDMFAVGKFDFILLDLQMPRVDGYQTIAFIRAQDAALPVIALTAHAFKEERDRAAQAGFTDYLTKPVDKALLIQTLINLF